MPAHVDALTAQGSVIVYTSDWVLLLQFPARLPAQQPFSVREHRPDLDSIGVDME
jgi:hypothetical protein